MSTTKKDQQNNQGNNQGSDSKRSAQPKQNQNSPKKPMQGNDSTDKKDRTQSR